MKKINKFVGRVGMLFSLTMIFISNRPATAMDVLITGLFLLMVLDND